MSAACCLLEDRRLTQTEQHPSADAQAARGPVGAALAAAASNRHREAAAAAQALRQLEANAMSGPECFDTEFYAAAHRDLWHLAGDAEALYL